jgi:hypothetical protein
MATIISSKTSGVGGLTVTGDNSGVLQLASADGTTALTIDASQNTTLVGTTTATNLAYTGTLTGSTGIVAIGTNQIYKDGSGNVGIGTASPSARLDVNTSSPLPMRVRGSGSASDNTQIRFYGNGTNADLYAIGTDIAAGGLGANFDFFDVVANTNRMRIDSSGNVGIGTTADSGAKMKISGATAGSQVLYVVNTTGSGNQGGIRSFLGASANNTSSFHFNGLTDTVANWYLYGNGTSSWSSDERLKKNIETTREGYINDVMKLRVVKYNWKNAEEGTPKELGLIAQEVEQVFPGLVQDDFNNVSEDDPIFYKQLKGSVLPMILLKTIQEQQTLIEALTARLTALEAK